MCAVLPRLHLIRLLLMRIGRKMFFRARALLFLQVVWNVLASSCILGTGFRLWATPPCTCWNGSFARPWLQVGWTAERDGSLLVFGAADHWHGSLMLLHLTGYMWCRER